MGWGGGGWGGGGGGKPLRHGSARARRGWQCGRPGPGRHAQLPPKETLGPPHLQQLVVHRRGTFHRRTDGRARGAAPRRGGLQMPGRRDHAPMADRIERRPARSGAWGAAAIARWGVAPARAAAGVAAPFGARPTWILSRAPRAGAWSRGALFEAKRRPVGPKLPKQPCAAGVLLPGAHDPARPRTRSARSRGANERSPTDTRPASPTRPRAAAAAPAPTLTRHRPASAPPRPQTQTPRSQDSCTSAEGRAGSARLPGRPAAARTGPLVQRPGRGATPRPDRAGATRSIHAGARPPGAPASSSRARGAGTTAPAMAMQLSRARAARQLHGGAQQQQVSGAFAAAAGGAVPRPAPWPARPAAPDRRSGPPAPRRRAAPR